MYVSEDSRSTPDYNTAWWLLQRWDLSRYTERDSRHRWRPCRLPIPFRFAYKARSSKIEARTRSKKIHYIMCKTYSRQSASPETRSRTHINNYFECQFLGWEIIIMLASKSGPTEIQRWNRARNNLRIICYCKYIPPDPVVRWAIPDQSRKQQIPPKAICACRTRVHTKIE